MTSPVWLIQADVFGQSAAPFNSEIRRQGMAFQIVQVRPFLKCRLFGKKRFTNSDRIFSRFSNSGAILSVLKGNLLMFRIECLA